MSAVFIAILVCCDAAELSLVLHQHQMFRAYVKSWKDPGLKQNSDMAVVVRSDLVEQDQVAELDRLRTQLSESDPGVKPLAGESGAKPCSRPGD